MTTEIIEKLVKIMIDPIHPNILKQNEHVREIIALMPPIDKLRLIRVLGFWLISEDGTRYLESLETRKT